MLGPFRSCVAPIIFRSSSVRNATATSVEIIKVKTFVIRVTFIILVRRVERLVKGFKSFAFSWLCHTNRQKMPTRWACGHPLFLG